ncbi:MAG: site-specific integrase [Caulobacteraceae bacterium]|nr:site-specific integrase [Caulobacteraceae bacterium]
MSYLEKIPKTGAYRFRRGIPLALRPYFPDRGTAWREPLNTKDPAEARRRCLEVSVKVEALFQQAQARHDAGAGQQAADVTALPVQLLKRLASEWAEAERNRRAKFIVVGDVMPGWPEFLEEANLAGLSGFEIKDDLPEEIRKQLSLGDATPADFMGRINAEDRFLNTAIREISERAGYLIGPEHPSHPVLWALIRGAWIEVLKSELRWRTHDFTDLPSEPPEPVSSQALVSARPLPQPIRAPVQLAAPVHGPRLSEAYDEWVRLSRPAARTAAEAKTALRQFTQLHGDLPVRSITKLHAREFRDLLARAPKHLPAKDRLRPLRELAEQAGRQPRAPQTINKTMNLLSGILSRQSKEGVFDDLHWANPFSVHLDVESADEDSYEPLNDTDLRKFFQSPVFSKGQRPKQGRGETAFWAPLLVLFHGTRRQDVMQLFVRDIRLDADTNCWFIDVNRDDGKSVKNAESVRQVPLHPAIIEMGFLHWWEKRRRDVGDHASLWPGFEDRAMLYGRINRWSKWLSDYLARHVVDHPRKKLHSFRGTFKRVGRGCGVGDPILDKICGHKIVTDGGKYGRKKRSNGSRDSGYPLNILAEHIARINFPGQEELSRVPPS